MRKYFFTFIIIVLTFIMPLTYGQEIEQTKVSNWAIGDIYEAEATALVPVDWQQSIHKVITPEQSSYIGERLESRFELIGLERQHDRVQESADTRGEVLEFYHSILVQYGIEGIEGDYLSNLQKMGVIKGIDEDNLKLNDSCTLQEALVFAVRIVDYVYATTDNGAKGLLWEVSDEDNTVYLLGTVHLGREKNYPLHKTLSAYMESVEKMAFELDFYDQQGIAYFQQKQMYLDGTTLKDYMPEEVYKKVVQAGAVYGFTEDDIKYIKPWALANLFITLANTPTVPTGKSSQQPIPAIDLYVYTKALLSDIEIIEIEGYEQQVNMFDSMNLDLQIQNLEEAINLVLEPKDHEEKLQEAETSKNDIELWLESFYEGDVAKFEESYPKDELLEADSEMMKVLFEKRDDHMSKEVLGYLKDTENDYMVVVGAGHMIGKEGIVQQLRDAGYTVNVVH